MLSIPPLPKFTVWIDELKALAALLD